MEAERPHHHHHHHHPHSSTSELFICFTSRLSSSSSMKLSSKSILSPSRNRDTSQISLSSSLSRRLRSNGSMKSGNGQASPMFPASSSNNGKKRGCAFENPEPSSPKVTCIGQVRVKTKKQGKKMRSAAAARSRKRRGGEASFRRTPSEKHQQQGLLSSSDLQQEAATAGLSHRNQRWVHLPVTICEALRTFGAEFSCLFPCRSPSSCGGGGREKEEEEVEGRVMRKGSGEGESREGSCGAAFARWLVALQEGDNGKGREIREMREIQLVVGEQSNERLHEEEEEEDEGDRRRDRPERSRRRHVFEDIEIDVDVEKKNENEELEKEEEKGRVSICIPPKNALLLMRCRSDPVKMAALANRFWDSPAHKDDQQDEDEVEQPRVYMEEEHEEVVPAVEEDDRICESDNEERQVSEIEVEPVVESQDTETTANPDVSEEKLQEENGNEREETMECVAEAPVLVDLEKPELEGFHQVEKENDEDYGISINQQRRNSDSELASSSSSSSSSSVISVASESENYEEQESAAAISVKKADEESTEEEEEEQQEEKEKETKERHWEVESTATTEDDNGSDPKKIRENKPGPVLPDCLLLMMCEPKLSMEVSKETWVCSTDFIRWLPERPARKKDGGDEPTTKKRISNDSKPPLQPAQQPLQPPRSSCSFPAAAHGSGMSMATMIEQKLVGSKGYEPFVLTRCKSEPMRSSAKLAPDACFWNNRKLEPHHRPATLGVGAAGVGF